MAEDAFGSFSWDGLQHATVTVASPAFASAVLVLLLGAYALRRRTLPGALPFAWMMLVAFPWLLMDALEVSLAGAAAKIFWFRLQAPLEIAVFTAELVFALEYADATRWTNRRNLALLAIPPVIALALALTYPAHHFLWADLHVRRAVHPQAGPGAWMFVAYAGVLSVLTVSVFVTLLIRGPRQRRPVVLCLCGVVVVRFAWVVEATGAILAGPLGHSTTRTAVAAAFAFAMYALAVFRYHMLETLSIARNTVIEQLREAVVVVDARGIVIDANPAAEATFGTGPQLLGRDAARVLPPDSGLDRILAGETDHLAFARGDGASRRSFVVDRTSLANGRRLPLGQVLLLRDVTDQRRSQELLVEQQHALGAADERDRIARELHDSLGQVLGYLKMQVQAARDLLASGRTTEANRLLAQAAAVAQDAHADVREYILAARTKLTEVGFATALEQYVRQFSDRYGLRTELNVDAPLRAGGLDAAQEVQLLRIVQEALTNARKHGHAHGARVTLGVRDGCAQATVEDDGVGFDSAHVNGERESKFGLAFMRERAEAVGGNLRVESAPGLGTRVVVSMPLRTGMP